MNPESAKTSIKQIPALIKMAIRVPNFYIPTAFRTRPCFFDFGAGKEGPVDEEMKRLAITYLPYDPFNRSNSCNFDSLVNCSQASFVTCANVLNVLEDEYLPRVIQQLAMITQKTRANRCFISVYHNPKLPTDRLVNGYFQRNQPINWYVEHLEECFEFFEKKGKFLTCRAKH